jgi:hypothetical protein
MTGFDDDLTAALRHDLAGIAVPHDDARADAVIRAATAHDPVGARSWQAPLAAAAAVVVVGGGAAVIAATHGGGGTPSGGVPAIGCATADPSSSVAPTPVPPLPATATAGSSRPATPTLSGAPNSASAASSYVPPAPPTTTAGGASPSSTGTEVETDAPSSSAAPDTAAPCASDADSDSPTTSTVDAVPPTPSLSPSSHAGGVRVGAPNLTFDIMAAPGTTRTEQAEVARASGGTFYAVRFGRVSGDGGTLSVGGRTQTFRVQDIARIDSPTGPAVKIYYLTAAQTPTRFQLTCSGTTTCRIRVSLSSPIPVGTPTATATPTR